MLGRLDGAVLMLLVKLDLLLYLQNLLFRALQLLINRIDSFLKLEVLIWINASSFIRCLCPRFHSFSWQQLSKLVFQLGHEFALFLSLFDVSINFFIDLIDYPNVETPRIFILAVHFPCLHLCFKFSDLDFKLLEVLLSFLLNTVHLRV